jgi:hypothetical protein
MGQLGSIVMVAVLQRLCARQGTQGTGVAPKGLLVAPFAEPVTLIRKDRLWNIGIESSYDPETFVLIVVVRMMTNE